MEHDNSSSIEAEEDMIAITANKAAESRPADGLKKLSEEGMTAIATNETAESLLADELNKLSFGERETVNEQIHGIDVGIDEETPQKVEASLHGMRKELDRLCAMPDNEIASALRRAREQLKTTTYLDSDDTLMMFLRSERFDYQKAAVRLCHYANLIHDFYGNKGLERWIDQSDIPEDEVAIMKMGRWQVLPGRDRSGRRVYMQFFSHDFGELSFQSKAQIFLYYALSMVRDDVDCQRRGVVCLYWMHNFRIDVKQLLMQGGMHGRLSRSIPVRVGAMHVLLPSPGTSEQPGTFALAKVFIAPAIGKHRRRMRLHWGSPMECFYLLGSFGISSKNIPLDLHSGQLQVANNVRWLELCAAREEAKKSKPLSSLNQAMIEHPERSDILLGRGNGIMYHPGNVIFRKYVEFHLDTYAEIASRNSRKEVSQWTKNMVNSLQTRYGVRFLKEGPNHFAWVEVSNEVARHKVRSAFRDAKQRVIQQRSNQHNGESKILSIGPSLGIQDRETLRVLDSKDPRVTLRKRQEEWDAYFASLDIADKKDLQDLCDDDENKPGQQIYTPNKLQKLPTYLDSSTAAFLGLTTTGHQEKVCCSSLGVNDSD